MKANLRTTRQRERSVAKTTDDFYAELVVCRKKSENVGVAVAAALEKALAAEALGESKVRPSQQTADTLSAAGAEFSDEAAGLTPGVGGGAARMEGQGVATAAVVSTAVVEGDFQRLRTNSQKAKGRITAMQELVTASRRAAHKPGRNFRCIQETTERWLTESRLREGVYYVCCGWWMSTCKVANQWFGHPSSSLFFRERRCNRDFPYRVGVVGCAR